MKQFAVLPFVLLMIAACSPSPKQTQKAIEQTQVAVIATITKAATSTAAPTNTQQPTNTPLPTNTTAPTKAPENTSTPEIIATESPAKEPITVTGNSDQFIDIPEEYQYSFIDFNYKGDSNFIVIALDGSNERMDSLVNAIGNYSGRHSLGFFSSENAKRLQVKTSGEWTITINPLELAYFHLCEIPGKCSGKGDDVIVFATRPDTGTIEHNGKENFIVKAVAEDGPETLVNEIGPYKGAVVFPPGTRFVEIIADGEWTMDITTK